MIACSLFSFSSIFKIFIHSNTCSDIVASLLMKNKEIVIMHPGPINRGVEITSEVADSNNSIILEQVENGVAIRMAVIYLLAKKNFDR